MRAKLYDYDEHSCVGEWVVDTPPPALILQDGKAYHHVGTICPDNVAVYRLTGPHRYGRNMTRAEAWVEDKRYKAGGYYKGDSGGNLFSGERK